MRRSTSYRRVLKLEGNERLMQTKLKKLADQDDTIASMMPSLLRAEASHPQHRNPSSSPASAQRMDTDEIIGETSWSQNVVDTYGTFITLDEEDDGNN